MACCTCIEHDLLFLVLSYSVNSPKILSFPLTYYFCHQTILSLTIEIIATVFYLTVFDRFGLRLVFFHCTFAGEDDWRQVLVTETEVSHFVNFVTLCKNFMLR